MRNSKSLPLSLSIFAQDRGPPGQNKIAILHHSFKLKTTKYTQKDHLRYTKHSYRKMQGLYICVECKPRLSAFIAFPSCCPLAILTKHLQLPHSRMFHKILSRSNPKTSPHSSSRLNTLQLMTYLTLLFVILSSSRKRTDSPFFSLSILPLSTLLIHLWTAS